MKSMERLDKILSNSGYGSRKEIKVLTKSGKVKVDGVVVKDSGMNVDPEKCKIFIGDEEVNYRKYIYLIMNKPAGVVSATFDNRDDTVIDLLEVEHAVFNPFPVGRLDKDTVGLLLLTNDGELNHKLISPKWHVDKVYYAKINKAVGEGDIKAFERGVVLDDGYKCMSAKLEVLKSEDSGSEVMVTIQEGKFHQVKRMFISVGKEVIYLKRMKFGAINLDETLEEGIVPGGGSALIYAREAITYSRAELDSDIHIGKKIVYKACASPFIKILTNAGYTVEECFNLINKMEPEDNDYWIGYDLKSESFVNMSKQGIIDPVKVTRNAIQNAASVAGTVLLTECTVVDKPEDKKPSMPDMGDMGGMF